MKVGRVLSGCYRPIVVEQPVRELAQALDRAGRFDYALDDDGPALFAYRRRG